MPNIVGQHLIADLHGIDPETLRDPSWFNGELLAAIDRVGLTRLGENLHIFPGGGFTGIYLLGESHVSIHTYPENGFLAFDAFTCGEHDPRRILDVLVAFLQPERTNIQSIQRGS